MEESNKNKKFPFDELAKKRGYAPEKLKSYRENCKNVSHILKGKNSKGEVAYIRIDLKKIKNKKLRLSIPWLEFKNPLGNPGWLHGDADFIVFERTDDFIFVNRKEVVSWCGSSQKIRYDLPFVSLAKRAKYSIYTRPDKKEELTQVELKEIKKLKSFQLWKK
jgi:hypothetical protein